MEIKGNPPVWCTRLCHPLCSFLFRYCLLSRTVNILSGSVLCLRITCPFPSLRGNPRGTNARSSVSADYCISFTLSSLWRYCIWPLSRVTDLKLPSHIWSPSLLSLPSPPTSGCPIHTAALTFAIVILMFLLHWYYFCLHGEACDKPLCRYVHSFARRNLNSWSKSLAVVILSDIPPLIGSSLICGRNIRLDWNLSTANCCFNKSLQKPRAVTVSVSGSYIVATALRLVLLSLCCVSSSVQCGYLPEALSQPSAVSVCVLKDRPSDTRCVRTQMVPLGGSRRSFSFLTRSGGHTTTVILFTYNEGTSTLAVPPGPNINIIYYLVWAVPLICRCRTKCGLAPSDHKRTSYCFLGNSLKRMVLRSGFPIVRFRRPVWRGRLYGRAPPKTLNGRIS